MVMTIGEKISLRPAQSIGLFQYSGVSKLVPPGYFKLDSYSIPVSSYLKLSLAVLISILFLLKSLT